MRCLKSTHAKHCVTPKRLRHHLKPCTKLQVPALEFWRKPRQQWNHPQNFGPFTASRDSTMSPPCASPPRNHQTEHMYVNCGANSFRCSGSSRLTESSANAKLELVNVISKPRLFEAARATRNPELVKKTASWYQLAVKNTFGNFVELKKIFRTADLVGDVLIFDLGSYRLICGFSFERRQLLFKHLLTHADYDRGGWKS